jgi:hypothetical protein
MRHETCIECIIFLGATVRLVYSSLMCIQGICMHVPRIFDDFGTKRTGAYKRPKHVVALFSPHFSFSCKDPNRCYMSP